IQASNTTVRGFAINRFPVETNGNGFGIGVVNGPSRPNNVWIYGNYIGTDPTGTSARPNGQGGIWVGSGTNVLIGTNADGFNDAAERNLISGNGGQGILVQNNSTTIAGNYVGTDVSGMNALPNPDGIVISGFGNL